MDTQQVRIWRKDDVLALIAVNDKAVVNAIKGLYARQTTAEQVSKLTRIANGRGFNAKDAPFLSDIAVKLPKYSDRMTPRQLTVARKMLRKYWRQLLEMIQEKGGVVEFPGSRKPEIANFDPVEEAYAAEAAEVPMELGPLPSLEGTVSARWGMF